MKAVLVSGAGGFLGSHLWPRLSHRFRLIGADLSASPADDREWLTLSSPTDLASVVEQVRPDAFVHAAFLNRKPNQWTDRRYLNAVLAVNLPLFECCATLAIPTLLISSSAVYGNPRGRDCFDETAPRLPIALYGVGKALQEMLGELQAAASGLPLLIVRLFNLIGPGQRPGMLLPDWVSQVKRIVQGGEPILRVRHLSTGRDFVDVRDAATAIMRLLEDFRPGEVVNVASGQSVSLGEISSFLQTLCPIPFQIAESDPTPLGTDITDQRGDAERLRQEWGWTPQFNWQQSIRDLWDEFDELER